MKLLMISLMIFSASSAFSGSNPLDAMDFAGEFKLVKASTKKGKEYKCADTVRIQVTANGVYLRSSGNAYENFLVTDAACKGQESDIGARRDTCTDFSETKVSHSMTEPITIVGFVNETQMIRLKGKDKKKLIYSNDTTLVPLGIMPYMHEDDFKCEYERL